jgi:lipopolysaccharide transport system permease protein
MDAKTSENASTEFVSVSSSPAFNQDLSPTPTKAQQWSTKKPYAVIKSEEGGVQLDLGEIWSYRELLYFLTLRDLKVRYKQTLMGIAWVLIQPLLTMLIFTLVFNRFVRIDTGGLPYPVFALSGLLMWLFMANGIVNSTNSLLGNTHLITKVYFPRMFIPAASVAAGLLDLFVSFLLLVPLMLYYGIKPTAEFALLPVFVLMMTALTLAVGLLFSAFTVKYRDLRHALPFVIQIWMFASPVIYPSSVVPQSWRWLVVFNPAAAIIEGFRGALTGQPLNFGHIGIAAVITLVLLAIAIYIFRRIESGFADVI